MVKGMQYDVNVKINHLGPIVYTDAYTDQWGTRRTDFVNIKVAPLPPQLSAEEQRALSAALLDLLHDYVLPELTKRYGCQVSEEEVLFAPLWQSQIRQVLIIVPVDGPPIVSLNEEVAETRIPAGCAHRLLLRDGYKWDVIADWLPQFPAAVQEQVHEHVRQLDEAIRKGDEKSAGDMGRLWFPALWEDSPQPIRQQIPLEIYALLFRLANRAGEEGSAFDSDPLEAIPRLFPRAVEGLKGSYTLESLQAEFGEAVAEAVAKLESIFSNAGLSKRERHVMFFEAGVEVRDEQLKWSDEDKALWLKMKPANYREALYQAKQKLQKLMQNNSPQRHPYVRLLEAILGEKTNFWGA
jgi:hypothetical protein